MKKHQKRTYSIVWQIIFFPLGVIILILIAAVFLCFFSIKVFSDQENESNINALQISLNQLDNELNYVDDEFIEYWNKNKSYAYLSKISEQKPVDLFLECQWETLNWMSNLISLGNDVNGAFVYYENINLLLFRGETNAEMHGYIKNKINEDTTYNHWELVTVEKQQYLVNIKKYNNFYGGVWMKTAPLMKNLIIEENMSGTVYMLDWKNQNTCKDAEVSDALKKFNFADNENIREKVYIGKQAYCNYIVRTASDNVYFGVLIPDNFFISNIPLPVKLIFILLLICVCLVPILIVWLRRKIAIPIQRIDKAMKAVGEGNMDYRIEKIIPEHSNELERLMEGFNEMLDEINVLEMNLYRTKIREQKIKMKYISQMIQPHFVLNALNIVYTYRENEFPLVKKMVRYLMEYFRYIVYLKTDFVTLEQEMRHIENYLKIQKERYLDAFDFFVEWESEASDCMIPPLIIQTFAENCLKYGRRNDNMVFVYVLANIQDDVLRLMIADSGDGFSEDSMKRIQKFVNTRAYDEKLGIGIQNAIERMDMLYGEKIKVNIHNALSGGAVVELFLPVSF